MSGNSSEMATVLSPNRSSMVSTWPPGSVIRLVSSAPSTAPYQAAAASGFLVTRWQVSELITRTIHTVWTACIDTAMGKLPAMVTSSGPHGRRSAGRRAAGSADGDGTTDLREAILAATAGLL